MDDLSLGCGQNRQNEHSSSQQYFLICTLAHLYPSHKEAARYIGTRIALDGAGDCGYCCNNYPDGLDTQPDLKQTKGYIGLPDHGSRIDFRYIKITGL